MTLAEYLGTHKSRCTGTPQLRLLGEDQRCRYFCCLTCHEQWIISRSKVKSALRQEACLDQWRRISAAERDRHKIFGAYYRGVAHG